MPRISLFTGTGRTAFRIRFSLLRIFSILERSDSILLLVNNCPIANSFEISTPCSSEIVFLKKSLSKFNRSPHPSPVFPSAPIAPR